MIARRSLLILLNNGVGTVVGFAGLFFVFRYMDKDVYGMYASAFALIGLFALINGLGVHAAHVKRISEGHHEGRANGTFLAIKLMMVTLFIAILGLAYVIWTIVLGQQFVNLTAKVLGVMVAVYTILAVRQFFDFTFRAHRRIAVSETVQFLDTLITSTAFLTAAQVWRHVNGGWVPFAGWADFWATVLRLSPRLSVEDGAILLTGGFFLGTVTSFVIAALFFAGHRYPLGRPTRASFRTYYDFAWPVALVSVMSVLYTNMDVVMVLYFWSTLEVADYRAAAKIVSPVFFVGQAIWTMLFPTVSDLHARGQQALIGPLVGRAERYQSMVMLGALTIAFVFAEEGLRIVSSEQYLSAAPTLRILIVSAFFSGLLVPARSVLFGSGNPKLMARVGLWITVVAVGLNLVLVPQSILGVPLAGLRAPGAAIGTAVAFATAYVYVKILAQRHANVPWVPPGLVRQIVAATAAGLLLWLAKTWLGPAYFDRFWELAITGTVGLLLYFGALVAVREFRKEDWDFAKEIAHPGKMGDYIRDELTGNRVRED